MSTAIENYGTLLYSPFVLAPLFEAFYETSTSQPNNLLLAYFVLPLTLPENCRSFLKRSRSTSSLRTFTEVPSRLYGLSARVQDFRRLTDMCLQFALNSGGMCLSNDLSVTFLARRLDASICPKDAIMASEKLGRLLQPYDIPTIYRFLGVKRL